MLSGRHTDTPKSRDGVVDAQIGLPVKQAAPTLLELFSVGPETVGQPA
ncbi:hypothetical protein [Streptomyces aureocirculatus]|nr:hypothetical protein [Streptomyces aureocirculatus]